MLNVKHVYEVFAPDDGVRYLVDRLWPRGIKKETLVMEAWLKDVAPSGALRRWFGHDPDKWTEFKSRYWAELDGNPDAWQPLLEAAKRGKVTLLYAARDAKHNNALVLKSYLEKQIPS